MTIPSHLLLCAEDIRHLRPVQLATLTDIDASNFAAWSQNRRFSERTLEHIAQKLRIDKPEVLRGFELRR
jgi:hypothetical protein